MISLTGLLKEPLGGAGGRSNEEGKGEGRGEGGGGERVHTLSREREVEGSSR